MFRDRSYVFECIRSSSSLLNSESSYSITKSHLAWPLRLLRASSFVLVFFGADSHLAGRAILFMIFGTDLGFYGVMMAELVIETS
jgi:hypothetical protein